MSARTWTTVDGPTPSETLNFYWHCDIATRLLTELPSNAAVSSHTREAVRKSTLCWTGARGIKQASERAHAHRADTGKSWRGCGLIREHVIPVSWVHFEVCRALAAAHDDLRDGWTAINDDMAAHGVSAAVIRGHQMHHRTIHAARAVRAWTEIAWAHPDDHHALKAAKLTESMPDPWDRVDRHARYTHCGLRILPIEPRDWN